MTFRIRNAFRFPALCFAIVLLTSTFAIPPEASSGKEGSFSGTWTASGKWDPLAFLEHREIFTYSLSGHVNLQNEFGETRDYWSECKGLWDAETGSTARCTWRDPADQAEAFLVLDGQMAEEGVEMTGRFVGGSGKLAGLTGKIAFTWSSVYRNQTERILTGVGAGLKGTYQLP